MILKGFEGSRGGILYFYYKRLQKQQVLVGKE
jgi:hypothetical protein